MLDYNGLYEYLRREKANEQLQQLPKDFALQFAEYLKEKKELIAGSADSFSDESIKEKKQFENAISIFRELILRRKKKILNLVFVASETGILKRDFGSMLAVEQGLFEELVSAIENADKKLKELLNGPSTGKEEQNKMIIITQPLGEFADINGIVVGPFSKGQLVNLDRETAEILVSENKATAIDS